jgi:hypothetical protein
VHVRLVPCRRLPSLPRWAVAVSVAWATAVVALRLLSGGAPGASPCWLRRAFGVPCPTCGGTRATELILRGEMPSAFLVNPLVATGLAVAAALVVLRLLAARKPQFLGSALERRAALTGAVALVVANWAYVLFRAG